MKNSCGIGKIGLLASASLAVYALLIFLASASIAAPLPFIQSSLFSGSGNCAVCHMVLKDQEGNDVSIDAHWRSTMMANAARDPYFQAKVSAELARFPQLTDVINDKCANCHMPMARTQALADQQTFQIFGGDGLFDPTHESHTLAMDAVSCTLCHQILDEFLGDDQSFSGGFSIDQQTAPPDRPIFGPFENPFTQNMRNMTGFTPVHSIHISESELCATCHTLFTPILDQDLNIVGEFPEQTVYLEWRQSDYAEGQSNEKSCQDCHLPTAEGGVAISLAPKNLAARQPFGLHHFVGGNTFTLSLLNQHSDELGATAEDEHFQATRQLTLNQLQQKTVDMNIVDANASGGLVNVALALRPLTGHKFPAGFPSRRAWIHFTVRGDQGSILFESGKPLDDGRISGNDSDNDLSTYEPHYDLIQDPEQVQIYESIMRDTQHRTTYTLLFAASYLKDNRLLPQGFDKQNARSETAVFGRAADDLNFEGGGDVIQYAAPVGDDPGPFTVQAELLYQSISHPFMADLEKETGEAAVRMVGYYNDADKTPVTITQVVKEGIVKETAVEDWKRMEK